MIHRLDPRVKFVSVTVLAVALFVRDSFLGMAVFALAAGVVYGLSRVPLVWFWRAFRPLLWLVGLTFVAQLLFVPGETFYSLGPLHLSWSGLELAAYLSVRLAVLVLVGTILTLTTPPMALTDGLVWLGRPLRRLGAPTHEMALIVTIALRFIPTLLSEAETIMRAQRARGVDFRSGGPIRRVRALQPILVPLFIVSFRRADDLALAMEARCYRPGVARTRLYPLARGAGRCGLPGDHRADRRHGALGVGCRHVEHGARMTDGCPAAPRAMERTPPPPPRSVWRLDLCYEGTAFRGWARQPGLRTVQGVLEEILTAILREPVRLSVAGRTDAGVHALAQVASFACERGDLAPDELRRSLNALLPPDVAVTGVSAAAGGFVARQALARTYRYRVSMSPVKLVFERPYVWCVHRRTDVELLGEAARRLRGVRDFAALTPSAHLYRSCVREVTEATWQPAGADEWVFEIRAQSFLHNMVRVAVGSMVDVARGRMTLAEFESALAIGQRRRMGQTAPPHGLALVAVEY